MPTLFTYLIQEQPDRETLEILGQLPKRWGRMDRLSRLAVVEVGRVLRAAGLVRDEGEKLVPVGCGGLIGGSRYGSLATDLAFAASMAGGVQTASPLLFGYTLPNIALAEAASHYGLTGPVYSLFSGATAEAFSEARRWLREPSGPDFMVAGTLDVIPSRLAMDRNAPPGSLVNNEYVSVNFQIERAAPCRT